ncbi:Protein of unknown function DUF818 [Trypanosoma melophagium]|uniref:Protein of unknown function DUF818 n=1 Tax=Trypanosoma melophagium TaxID=715481 RepID=UPI00351A95C0|nr:Protein of unknown function DUF818 [Trypanosoma melophagium]
MATFFGSIVKSIILPKPSPSYNTAVHPGKLVHIPRVDWKTRKENGTFTYGLLLIDPTAKYIVIYAHMNAVDMGMMFDELSYLSKRASASVLLFEYTGYGISHGETTEKSINEDMLSAYCYAIRYLHVPANRIVIMGRSIGTGPSAQLCAAMQDEDDTPALLVIQSPFTSLKECANEIARNVGSIVRFLGYDWFRTIDVIAQVRCPVIIHHGSLDDVVPFEHAERIKRAIEEASPPGIVELHVEECKHNDLPATNAARIIDKKLRELGQERCLQLKYKPHLIVNPPIYEYLFYVQEKHITTIDALLYHWNETLKIGSLMYKREKLHILLVASVSLFAMRCAQMWQCYTGSWKRYHAAETSFEGLLCNKEEFINRCLACWGSPLGIFIGTEGNPVFNKLFGAHLKADIVSDNESSIPSFMMFNDRLAYLTVAELEFTPGLMKSVVAAVSTAPKITEDGDRINVFIQKEIATRIQTECERLVGFLDDNEWDNLLLLLLNFNTAAPSFLSSKSFHFYSESTSANAGVISQHHKKESIADVEEWLRPWLVSPKVRSCLGAEVPWDYYLLKARLCVQENNSLGSETSWKDAKQIVDSWQVVADIHRLFNTYSRRCIRPTFLSV